MQPLWDLTWWAGILPILLSVFLLRGIDLIILGVMVIFAGAAVSDYLKKDERIGQHIISIVIAFWMWLIIIESAKILQKPDTPLSLTHPLVLYTIASVTSTIIIVFLTYKRYKRLPFT
jgi:hypothetical protein